MHRMLAEELKRILLNYKSMIVILGIVLLNMLSVYANLDGAYDTIGIYVMEITGMTIYPLFSIILCMWGYGSTIYEDRMNNHIRNVGIRCSGKYYVCIKYVSIMLVTIVSQFLGQIITVAIVRMKYPMLADSAEYENAIGTYAYLAENKALLFVMVTSFIYAMWMTVYVLCAQIVSIITDNLFLIISAPILIYYGVVNIGYIIPVPNAIYPNIVFSIGGTILMSTVLKGVLYCMLYIVVLSAILIMLTGNMIRKKM